VSKKRQKSIAISGDWQNTRIYRNAQNRIIICHILYMDFNPLDTGDYAYYFVGNFGNVCVSFEGAYTDTELKSIVHHVINSDYANHNLKLVNFLRTNHLVAEYASTLKESRK